jgi:hypothetical protein
VSRSTGPRIRSLKPECWQDERLAGVSRDARLLYVGLVTQADDEGRESANVALIRSRVFPFDTDLPLDDVSKWLGELEHAGLVQLYDADGRALLQLISWADDQRVDRPTPSALPAPPDPSSRTLASDREDSRSFSPSRARADRTGPDQTGPDQDRTESARRRASPAPSPDVEQVFAAWVAATDRDRTRTQLTSQRRRQIERALASHGLDDCLAAVRNIGADEWARGANDRGQRYDDVKHALGSAERLERWRDRRQPAPHGSHGNGKPANDWDAALAGAVKGGPA